MLIYLTISWYTFFDIPTDIFWISHRSSIGILEIFLRNEKHNEKNSKYLSENKHSKNIYKICFGLVCTYQRKTFLLIIHLKDYILLLYVFSIASLTGLNAHYSRNASCGLLIIRENFRGEISTMG